MGNYKWRFCAICNERIFANEVEGDTIKTANGILYCIDCAEDVEKNGDEHWAHKST